MDISWNIKDNYDTIHNSKEVRIVFFFQLWNTCFLATYWCQYPLISKSIPCWYFLVLWAQLKNYMQPDVILPVPALRVIFLEVLLCGAAMFMEIQEGLLIQVGPFGPLPQALLFQIKSCSFRLIPRKYSAATYPSQSRVSACNSRLGNENLERWNIRLVGGIKSLDGMSLKDMPLIPFCVLCFLGAMGWTLLHHDLQAMMNKTSENVAKTNLSSLKFFLWDYRNVYYSV